MTLLSFLRWIIPKPFHPKIMFFPRQFDHSLNLNMLRALETYTKTNLIQNYHLNSFQFPTFHHRTCWAGAISGDEYLPQKQAGEEIGRFWNKHSHKIHETKCIFAKKNMLHDFMSMESMINVGKYIPSSHGSCGPQNHRTSKSIQQLKTQGSRALNLLGNPLLWTYWVKRLDVYSCQENTTTWNGIWV